jgi:hypothetical protein
MITLNINCLENASHMNLVPKKRKELIRGVPGTGLLRLILSRMYKAPLGY